MAISRQATSTSGQATFVMDHFRVAAPGRLEVEGRWDGVQGAHLDDATLALHVEDRVDRVEAESVRRTARAWHGLFLWDGDPSAIKHAYLEVGGQFVVEFGAQPSTRRRLGRTTHPVLPLAAEPVDAAAAALDGDVVSLHGALVAAQDQVAEARDEADFAREEARRAVADAQRERSRRQSEAARLHDAIDTLKLVADEALRTERERVGAQAEEIERLGQALTGARTHAATAQEAIEAAVHEREQIVKDARTEIESAQRELAGARREIGQLQARHSELSVLLSDARAEAERAGEVEADHEAARAALAEAQKHAEGFRNEAQAARAKIAELSDANVKGAAELQRVQAEVEQAREIARRSARELERAVEDAREARRLHEAVQRLEAALAEARTLGADAAADAARFRDRLGAIRSALAED